MARGDDSDRTSIKKEIRIAVFWRDLIGDYEYIKFDPDDMLRWYLAMEVRGPVEVAALMAERFAAAARRSPVVGLVGQAPHPPAWLVREWLGTQRPKFPQGRAVTLGMALLLFVSIALPTLHSCVNLKNNNPLAYQPPNPHPAIVAPGAPSAIQTPQASAPIATPSTINAGTSAGAPPALGASSSGAAASGGSGPPAASTGSGTISTVPASTGISGAKPPS
jgi:hypothetical protein